MKLHVYASGDGALHFSWLENGVAPGRKVKLSEAKRHFNNTKDCENLRERKFRLVVINGRPCLVAPIKRVGPKCLEREGIKFRYEYKLKGEYPYFIMAMSDAEIIFELEASKLNRVILQNTGIKTSLIHFLKYEDQICSSTR